MKSYLNSIRLSARNLGNITTVAVCGMLLALSIILGFFTVPVSHLLKIGFSFLPIAAAGILFGPVTGGTVGALGDIVGYMIRPAGAYFPGFTVSGFVSGFLYGLILYRKPVTLRRSVLAKAAVSGAVSFLLNPLWLSILYGKAFWAIFSVRVVGNLAEFPIDAFLLFMMLKLMGKSPVSRLKNRH